MKNTRSYGVANPLDPKDMILAVDKALDDNNIPFLGTQLFDSLLGPYADYNQAIAAEKKYMKHMESYFADLLGGQIGTRKKPIIAVVRHTPIRRKPSIQEMSDDLWKKGWLAYGPFVKTGIGKPQINFPALGEEYKEDVRAVWSNNVIFEFQQARLTQTERTYENNTDFNTTRIQKGSEIIQVPEPIFFYYAGPHRLIKVASTIALNYYDDETSYSNLHKILDAHPIDTEQIKKEGFTLDNTVLSQMDNEQTQILPDYTTFVMHKQWLTWRNHWNFEGDGTSEMQMFIKKNIEKAKTHKPDYSNDNYWYRP